MLDFPTRPLDTDAAEQRTQNEILVVFFAALLLLAGTAFFVLGTGGLLH